LLDEGERFLRLCPQRAVHVLWQPNDDGRDLVSGARLTEKRHIGG
jgi:hypothetical protein